MRNELLVPGACDVVEVSIEDDDMSADSILVIRSIGRRGEQLRRMRAPRPTVQHAATAVARHYGLSRDGRHRWLAPASAEHVTPLAG